MSITWYLPCPHCGGTDIRDGAIPYGMVGRSSAWLAALASMLSALTRWRRLPPSGTPARGGAARPHQRRCARWLKASSRRRGQTTECSRAPRRSLSFAYAPGAERILRNFFGLPPLPAPKAPEAGCLISLTISANGSAPPVFSP